MMTSLFEKVANILPVSRFCRHHSPPTKVLAQASREAAQQASHELVSSQRECTQLRASLEEANDSLQHGSTSHDTHVGQLKEALQQAEVTLEVNRAKAAAYDELNAEKQHLLGQLHTAQKAEAALASARHELKAMAKAQQVCMSTLSCPFVRDKSQSAATGCLA